MRVVRGFISEHDDAHVVNGLEARASDSRNCDGGDGGPRELKIVEKSPSRLRLVGSVERLRGARATTSHSPPGDFAEDFEVGAAELAGGDE